VRAMLNVKWFDAGMEPKETPNPKYPFGIDVDLSEGKHPTCSTALPYPARRIGHFKVSCDRCRLVIALTTAGRADDPRSIRIACRSPKHA
jgi:hypothetical protein